MIQNESSLPWRVFVHVVFMCTHVQYKILQSCRLVVKVLIELMSVLLVGCSEHLFYSDFVRIHQILLNYGMC
jgi:hypothetical protein